MTVTIAPPAQPAPAAPAAPAVKAPLGQPVAAVASAAAPTAVLGWLASLTAATTQAPVSVTITMTLSTVTITVPSMDAYRQWCSILSCPDGVRSVDDLGGLAHTQATVGGWYVDLLCHLPATRKDPQ